MYPKGDNYRGSIDCGMGMPDKKDLFVPSVPRLVKVKLPDEHGDLPCGRCDACFERCWDLRKNKSYV